MLQYEQKYWQSGKKYLAGIDEAGRGPLAGPVVSAAVILPQDIELPGVKDSKKISEKKREVLYGNIQKKALSVGIGWSDVAEIDEKNILQATYQSMRQAVGNLHINPEILEHGLRYIE